MYHGTHYEDVVDHIAKVLKMVDLIYFHGVNFHQLRMKVFPLSLADDAKEWWISDGEDEMLDEGENWGIDPPEFLSNINISFKYHKKVDGRTQKDIEKEILTNIGGEFKNLEILKCWSLETSRRCLVRVVLLVKDCRMINHQYAVSIKEDMAYLCLHSPMTTEDKAQYVISRETQYAIFKIWNQYNILEDIKRGPNSKKSPIRRDLDNSTSNVLIPLDSWTSGLLVYELPLSDALIVIGINVSRS
ncbi:hypothetical protein Tco_0694587 [Tanacetum coccineum]